MANSSPVTRDELKILLDPIAARLVENRKKLDDVGGTVIRIETQQKLYKETVDAIGTRLLADTRSFAQYERDIGILDSRVKNHEKRLDRQDKRSMGLGGASGGIVSASVEFIKGLFGG
jgi:hypothetical protein